MAYPETKGKSFAIKFLDAFKSLFVETEKQKELVVPNHEVMQEKCLNIYLEKYNKILRNCDLSHQHSITRVTEEVFHIFQLLYLPRIHHHSDVHYWRAKLLPEVSSKKHVL